jgi:hypothetical protein
MMKWLCWLGLHKERSVTINPGMAKQVPVNAPPKDHLLFVFLDQMMSELQFWCQRCGKRVY